MNAATLFRCDTCKGLFPADEIVCGEESECESCQQERVAEAMGACRRYAPPRAVSESLIDAADFARTFAKEHP